jgi:hypothetical protein
MTTAISLDGAKLLTRRHLDCCAKALKHLHQTKKDRTPVMDARCAHLVLLSWRNYHANLAAVHTGDPKWNATSRREKAIWGQMTDWMATPGLGYYAYNQHTKPVLPGIEEFTNGWVAALDIQTRTDCK